MARKNALLFVLVITSISLIFISADPQIVTYQDLNISSDRTVYSCWQDSAIQSCSALINLTIGSNSSLANQIWNVSLNNAAQIFGITYGIEWKNASGTWINQSTNNTIFLNYNLTASTHEFRINLTLPSALSTKWNISFGINGTFYVLDPYLDSINLTSPPTYSITTDQTPDFNFTLFSNNWTTQSCNLSLRLNDGGSWTVYSTNNSIINGSSTALTPSSNIAEGNYTWKITCNVTGDSASRWIYIDDISPPILSVSVSNKTASRGSLSVTTNENVIACNYSGADSDSLSGSGTSWSATLSGLSASTNYTVAVTCTDTGKNIGSGSHSFTTSSSDSNGGTTDDETTPTAYWTTLTTLTNDQFTQGYTKELAVKNRVKFVINSTDHYVGVIALTTTTATINVSSTTQQATMSVGQEKKFELTNDTFYDVSIKLEGIKNNKANLTIKSIREEVPITTITPNATACTSNWTCTKWSACVNATKTRTCTDSNNCTSTQDKPAELETCKKTSLWGVWLILITIAVAVVVVLVILIIKRRRG